MSKASDTSCDILTVDTENVTSAKNQDYFFRKTKSQSASASRDQSEPLLMEPEAVVTSGTPMPRNNGNQQVSFWQADLPATFFSSRRHLPAVRQRDVSA